MNEISENLITLTLCILCIVCLVYLAAEDGSWWALFLQVLSVITVLLWAVMAWALIRIGTVLKK